MNWTDDRARQETITDDGPRTERETRVDTGASDRFADDRLDVEREPDAGEQSTLGAAPADDGDQLDLTGDTATTAPSWAQDSA